MTVTTHLQEPENTLVNVNSEALKINYHNLKKAAFLYKSL